MDVARWQAAGYGHLLVPELACHEYVTPAGLEARTRIASNAVFSYFCTSLFGHTITSGDRHDKHGAAKWQIQQHDRIAIGHVFRVIIITQQDR